MYFWLRVPVGSVTSDLNLLLLNLLPDTLGMEGLGRFLCEFEQREEDPTYAWSADFQRWRDEFWHHCSAARREVGREGGNVITWIEARIHERTRY